MSTRYDTIGIILASGNDTLSNGTPSVLAQIDGVSILERTIDAHMDAWAMSRTSPPLVVAVDRKHAELIRKEIEAATYGSGLVRYTLVPDPDSDGSSDTMKTALAQLRALDVYPENVVISMGNAGLWRPETLRAVRDNHLAAQKERASVMSVTSVPWKTYPEVLWNHGSLVYARPAEPFAHYLKEVREYWQCGVDRNGQVGATTGDVSAKLFCVDFDWLLNCVGRYSTQYQDRRLPPECFLHRLVFVLYQQEQRQPATVFCLPSEQAHEALDIRSDYDLEYARKVLQGLSSPDKAWNAAMRFAAEYAAAARATA